jgi:hypothetical protein
MASPQPPQQCIRSANPIDCLTSPHPGINDRAGQVLVAKEVGYGEVLQAEPVVGLDELAGDIMKKASPDVGDTGMLARQPQSCLGPIA